jgi:hypothetical protein
MKRLFGNVYLVKVFNVIPVIGIMVNSKRKAIVYNTILLLVLISVGVLIFNT